MKPVWTLFLLLLPTASALSPGDPVSLPTVRDSFGNPVNLARLAREGHYLLFFFFPKAFTPGCTAQAKRYAELHEEFRRFRVEVFGVSADSAKQQCDFVERLGLKGAMIPDREGILARLFGVRGLLGFYSRDTILVNPQSRIERIWRNVDPNRDADTALAHVRQLRR
ncbi:MAG: peroxiredoxin [Thermus sp.]|uniref:peroxiredoxin n=1 Tax=Thermus sp. TaxID=275 RepID=UPI0039187C3A